MADNMIIKKSSIEAPHPWTTHGPYPLESYFAFLQYFTVNSISGNGKISFFRQCGIWLGYLQQMILVCHSRIIN